MRVTRRRDDDKRTHGGRPGEEEEELNLSDRLPPRPGERWARADARPSRRRLSASRRRPRASPRSADDITDRPSATFILRGSATEGLHRAPRDAASRRLRAGRYSQGTTTTTGTRREAAGRTPSTPDSRARTFPRCDATSSSRPASSWVGTSSTTFPQEQRPSRDSTRPTRSTSPARCRPPRSSPPTGRPRGC